jgi:hypothetical protein
VDLQGEGVEDVDAGHGVLAANENTKSRRHEGRGASGIHVLDSECNIGLVWSRMTTTGNTESHRGGTELHRDEIAEAWF